MHVQINFAEDRIVSRLFGFVWMEAAGKFVVSCQEKESEQPLCLSGEGQSCKRTEIWQKYLLMWQTV